MNSRRPRQIQTNHFGDRSRAGAFAALPVVLECAYLCYVCVYVCVNHVFVGAPSDPFLAFGILTLVERSTCVFASHTELPIRLETSPHRGEGEDSTFAPAESY